MAGTTWTAQTEALLTRLWTEEGRTFAEIAEAVSRTGFVVSRAAVAGRVRRLELVGKQFRPVGEPTIVEAKINIHPAGAWPIDALREGQCRFACTGHNVSAAEHRFCGARTHVGPGNLHGSWCPEHLARMYDRSSRLARPSFLKRAGDHR